MFVFIVCVKQIFWAQKNWGGIWRALPPQWGGGIWRGVKIGGEFGGHCPPRGYGLQRRTKVRWRPGQGTSLATACSNLRSFGSICTVLKTSSGDIIGTFRPSPVIRRLAHFVSLGTSLAQGHATR